MQSLSKRIDEWEETGSTRSRSRSRPKRSISRTKNHPERDLRPTVETVEEVSDTEQIPSPEPAKDDPVKRLDEALTQTRDERLQKAKVSIDVLLI